MKGGYIIIDCYQGTDASKAVEGESAEEECIIVSI
jgi:hypothetical protein